MNKEFFHCCKSSHKVYGYTAFLCKVCRKMFTGVKALREVRTDLKLMQDRVMVLEQEKEVLVLNLERIKKGAEKVTGESRAWRKRWRRGWRRPRPKSQKAVCGRWMCRVVSNSVHLLSCGQRAESWESYVIYRSPNSLNINDASLCELVILTS